MLVVFVALVAVAAVIRLRISGRHHRSWLAVVGAQLGRLERRPICSARDADAGNRRAFDAALELDLRSLIRSSNRTEKNRIARRRHSDHLWRRPVDRPAPPDWNLRCPGGIFGQVTSLSAP